jgi:hypothetical protein
MSYALSPSMTGLVACPFCRKMFEPHEAQACPECGLRLESISKLPPSYDAIIEFPEEPIPPHMETLPWGYVGRARALLLCLSLAGLACFFAPWVRETAPEIQQLSGFELARRLTWLWAPAIAFFVMAPLVVTRRSIYKMRGARVAVGFLSGIGVTTVGVRLFFSPHSSVLRPVRYEWGWGLYATGVVALVALAASYFFGGPLDDVPTKEERRGDETLH